MSCQTSGSCLVAPDGAKLECCGEKTHPECLPISIPHDDPFYAKYGLRCMEFVRAVVAKKEHCSLGKSHLMTLVYIGFIGAIQHPLNLKF